ncbi:hypothetical protein AFLA_007548 [Aspergillus flavus NRRL3357]|nr:hypothetical protein AFLA_007548 [Aspergillus flavus NRRL3357]
MVKKGYLSPLKRCPTARLAIPEARLGLLVCSPLLISLRLKLICHPLYDPEAWAEVSAAVNARREIVGVVVYGNADSPISNATIPMLQHLAGASATAKVMSKNSNTQVYGYANVDTYQFATPFQGTFDYTTEAVSHTRNLGFLKPLIGGPYFDLKTIWEEHTQHEFETRSVPHTMATMMQEPYVNHIPTLTGGIGRAHFSTFYQNHFIFNNPADAELELISRTLGIDRVVDEFIYKFTHDTQIDWLGLSGKAKLEYRVPGAGRETAEKMRDKNAVESNQLFRYGLRVVDPLRPLSPS